MRADLHIHTTASDGTWTPQELVQAAVKLGLGAIAVTDHDNVSNVLAAQRLALEAGLQFIPGVEVCATKGALQLHILGYGIDVHNKQLLELLQHNENLLLQKDIDSIAILEREGWPVSAQEFRSYTYDRRRGGWGSLAYLIDKGLCTGVQDFFSRIFTPEHDLGFPCFASVQQVVDAIHGAGGVALCAHAASDFHGPGLDTVLQQLESEQLDGFECYHSGHSPEAAAKLVDYCKQRKLLISGGSDSHGSFVPSRHLGQPQIEIAQLHLPGLLGE